MIQFIFRHILRNLALLPALMMVLALGACRNEAEPADPSVDAYYVNIRITTGAQRATRSVLPEEEGSEIENTISLSDLTILVFDENRVLKDYLYKNGNPIGDVHVIKTGMGEYVVSSWLDGGKYNKTAPISVVVLANYNAHKEIDPNAYPATDYVIGQTRYEELAEKIFRLNDGNPSQAWSPSDDSLIPMFGVLYTSLSGYSDSVYNHDNPMELGTINVLRSVAKFEIIDNASNDEVKITSIVLNKRNRRGFLTHDILDYQNTQQVTKSNIPDEMRAPWRSPESTTTPLIFRKNGNVYEAYVPEMDLAETLDERMSLDVNIESESGYTNTIKLALAPYNSAGKPFVPANGFPDEWVSLLRNHIYRYDIQEIKGAGLLDLTVKVEPWEAEHLELDFTNNIAMADDGALTFTAGTYASLDSQTGRVVLNDFPQAAIGTFGISEPKGSKWSAYLIPTGGELDAIKFVITDADGKTTTASSVSGIIDGKKVSLRVAAAKNAGNTLNTAKLQIIVTTPFGNSVPVNVLRGGQYGSSVENITFIQNPQ